jgi:pimeloyl-ACP methyl ester carboxylesterase
MLFLRIIGIAGLHFATASSVDDVPDLPSAIFDKVCSCLSESMLESVRCILRNRLAADDISDAILTKPDYVSHTILQVGDMQFEAWSYPTPLEYRPAIILLPGMTGHQGLLRALAKSLRDEFRVFSLDVLGYGLSTGSLPEDMMEGSIKSVEALMDTFGLEDEKTIIIGHSLEGIVAQNMGARHPGLMGIANIDGGNFNFESEVEPQEWAIMRTMNRANDARDLSTLMDMVRTGAIPQDKVFELIELSQGMRNKVRGSSDAWFAWLDSYYASGEWNNDFATCKLKMLFFKAAGSTGALELWKGVLTHHFNALRNSGDVAIEVIGIVSNHLQIALLSENVEVITTAIKSRFLA